MVRHYRPRHLSRLPRVGDAIRVIDDHSGHGLTLGERYIVRALDRSLHAVEASPPLSKEKGVRLDYDEFVEADAIGWEWIKTQIPEQDIAILEAFDGIEKLVVNPTVAALVVARVDDIEGELHHAVRDLRFRWGDR